MVGSRFVVTGGADGLADLKDYLHTYTSAGGDRLVFAVGGDGTVRACAEALAHTGAALAIVPAGLRTCSPERSVCRERLAPP